MTIRQTLFAFAACLATYGFAAPALAQEDEEVEIVELSPEDIAYDTCFYGEGEVAEQEAACSDLINGDDKTLRAWAYSSRARLRLADDREEEAFADFATAIKLKPRDVNGYINRASAYSELKKHDLAMADVREALKIEPMSHVLHNQLCWELVMEGKDLDRAVSYCNLAIGLSPTYTPARDSRGMAYLKMGKFDLALADYEKAVKLSPRGAHYMYGRGIALLRLGRKADGESWIKEALKADEGIAKQYESYGVKP